MSSLRFGSRRSFTWPKFRRSLRTLLGRNGAGVSVDEVTDICRRAANGDLEARITGANTATGFGKMCTAINAVLDTCDAFVREAAAAMENCSHDQFHRPILLRGMKGSYRQSSVIINQAADRMRMQSENLQFVSSQAEETANNVHTVAAACEELNATTTEISAQAADAANKARAVTSQVDRVNQSFARLQEAVAKIDKVVDLLNSVTLQTQLLGLNATIEAAHAGEYGASFAVVAAEVKNLSDETRKATDEISFEIHEIKSTAGQAADTLRGVTDLMKEFEGTAGAIDTSVREQVDAAGSIANSISSVSQMSEEVSARIRGSRNHEVAAKAE
jgi:methyl-accepting chemotaxis protein